MNSTTENTQVRAGCYCRISSDPNDKREGVDRQRQDTAVLCEVESWQVAGVYVDDDRSASNGKKRERWRVNRMAPSFVYCLSGPSTGGIDHV